MMELIGLKWLTASRLVFLAGMLHFCQVPALFVAPRMLDWKEELAKLQPINRTIYLVIGWAIVLTVLGLGVVVMLDPDSLVSGNNRLGMGLAAFLGIFWAYRAAVQALVYPKIWPGGLLGRASHYGLLALLTFLSAVYLMAFYFSLSL